MRQVHIVRSADGSIAGMSAEPDTDTTAVNIDDPEVQAYLRKEPIGPALKQGVNDIFSSLASGARNMVAVALARSTA